MARKDKKKVSKEKVGRAVLSALRQSRNGFLSFKELVVVTGARDKARQKTLSSALNDLTQKGRIEFVKKHGYRSRSSATLVGTIKMNARGGGFFSGPGLVDEIKIGNRSCGQALNGDTVEVEFFDRPGREGSQGRVLGVVERARTQFVGTIHRIKNHTFLVPDDPKIHVDFYVPSKYEGQVANNDKALVELLDWPEGAGSPFAKIIEVLGPAGDHEVEMVSILADHGLPHSFPERVESEAKRIAGTKVDLSDRRDLRDLVTLTIDPYDAKDLDDAISYKLLDNGRHQVGIHIADVSHFVTPGSLVDKEAYKRATSVYLVDRVVPMLPEALSNGVCSLSDDSDKLCFSALFEMDEDNKVLKEWFGRTIIRSNKRFSYEEAQEVLDENTGPFSEELAQLNKISASLRKQRLKSGSLNIGSTEVKFKLDENNIPVEVVEKKMKQANFLIEDLMLLANRRVASFISKKKSGGRIPSFVYRIHDNPDPEKLRTLKVFVEKFGHKLKLGGDSPSRALNELLSDIEDTEEAHIIRQLTIRSMAKAAYSTDNIGHFGLAFTHYTHFTSPIRRYPDLMVHRALAHYLSGGDSLNLEELEKKCVHSSKMERKAIEAERDSIKHMQSLYLSAHLGEEFEGVVSGLTRWGMYVELNDILCEGLVSIRNIPGDHFRFDERRFCIVGSQSGVEYNFGDKLRVRVDHVDLERKTVDLSLVEGAIPD